MHRAGAFGPLLDAVLVTSLAVGTERAILHRLTHGLRDELPGPPPSARHALPLESRSPHMAQRWLEVIDDEVRVKSGGSPGSCRFCDQAVWFRQHRGSRWSPPLEPPSKTKKGWQVHDCSGERLHSVRRRA